MSKIVVRISDMAVSNSIGSSIVTYALGSCLCLVLYDKKLKLAAMLHSLLPEGKDKTSLPDFNPFKYVDTAVPLLFKECYKFGATKHSLKAYAFGCATIRDAANVMNIGDRNYTALQKILWKNNVFLEQEFVGGTTSRTVEIQIDDGLILLKQGNSAITIQTG